MNKRDEENAARAKEARDILKAQAAERTTFANSAMATAARRAGDHFAARDAEMDAANDPIELWGRRIGRALSLAAFIGLSAYLYVTYVN